MYVFGIVLVNNFMMCNKDVEECYWEVVVVVIDESLVQYLESFVCYCNSFYELFFEWMNVFLFMFMFISKQACFYLYEYWGEFCEVLLFNNKFKVVEFCEDSEKKIFGAYCEVVV